MAEKFSADMYHHFLLNADVRGAVSYLQQFPEQAALSARYDALFEADRELAPTDNSMVNAVLTAYAAYYRESLWLQMMPAAAEINLADRIRSIFAVTEPMDLQTLEDTVIAAAFADAGFHFLGGRTGGRRGPYVWQDTETRTYEVELPEGTRNYTVKLLSGFIHKSWLDYISFGVLSTGGWVDDNGMICCTRESYDTDSESFRVSLLKHEAQHASDMIKYPRIKPHELEYRAKLAELIFSTERDMLEQFLQEADPAIEASDHAYAAEMVIQGLCRQLQCVRGSLSAHISGEIKDAAKLLFSASSAEMAKKYTC